MTAAPAGEIKSMNSIMAHSAIPFAGAQAVNPARAPANIPLQPVASVPRFTIAPMLQPPLPASLPLAATASGNLFLDRNDASLHWYLPHRRLHKALYNMLQQMFKMSRT